MSDGYKKEEASADLTLRSWTFFASGRHRPRGHTKGAVIQERAPTQQSRKYATETAMVVALRGAGVRQERDLD